MTAQKSDILINEHTIDFGWLKPYGVCSEDGPARDSDCFPVAPHNPEPDRCKSSLWRGYVATFRLCADGRLELVRYDFPYASKQPAFQLVNKFFRGDFSIILRPFCFGPKTRVPFRNGTIVEDRTEWNIDDQTLPGQVTHVLHRRDTNEPVGLIVDIGFPAFMPRSLVPADLRNHLDAQVGRLVDCQMKLVDEVSGSVLVEPLKFYEQGELSRRSQQTRAR